jgi:hypothetical protein
MNPGAKSTTRSGYVTGIKGGGLPVVVGYRVAGAPRANSQPGTIETKRADAGRKWFYDVHGLSLLGGSGFDSGSAIFYLAILFSLPD